MKTKTKEAAAPIRAKRSARTQNYYKTSYQQYRKLSNGKTKDKLATEILFLLCTFYNQHLSPEEQTTCKLLFLSTVHKFVGLQNGVIRLPHRISEGGCIRGFSGVESTNAGQRVIR